jgi:hypothetical protein
MKIISALGYSTQQNYHTKLTEEEKSSMIKKKKKLKQHVTIKLPLWKILQGILHTEDESKQNHQRSGRIKLQEKKRQVIRG